MADAFTLRQSGGSALRQGHVLRGEVVSIAPHVVDATVGVIAAVDETDSIATDDAAVSAKPTQDATVSIATDQGTISAKPTEDKTI